MSQVRAESRFRPTKTGVPPRSTTVKPKLDLVDDVDALLDEIDAVLEDNVVEVVQRYRQANGE